MNFVDKLLSMACFCLIVSSAARTKRLNFLQLIEKHGYTGEYHYATTDDGYILRIDRITSSPTAPETEVKPVVFIQHGILTSSEFFVFWHHKSSLAFALADAGYDVWLGNARGNTNSRNHTTFSTDSNEFWSFSYDEISTIDLSTMIDYVLESTDQDKLSLIGRSCGSRVTYILLSEKPEYNEKVNLLVSLPPVAYSSPLNLIGAVFMIGNIVSNLQRIKSTSGYEVGVLESSGDIQKACGINPMCVYGLNAFGVEPSIPFTAEQRNYVNQYYPTGTSLQLVNHIKQNIVTRNYDLKKFAKYDYEDKKKNNEKYGQDKPPEYPTSKITAPVALFWSLADGFESKINVDQITEKLPNLISTVLIQDFLFNHADYYYHPRSKELYINKVLELIDEYTS